MAKGPDDQKVGRAWAPVFRPVAYPAQMLKAPATCALLSMAGVMILAMSATLTIKGPTISRCSRWSPSTRCG